MAKNLTPAEYVIEAFGGLTAASKALGVFPSGLVNWRKRNNGMIPGHNWRHILKVAGKMGVTVTVFQLMYGSKGK
jgi:hypothetical protein